MMLNEEKKRAILGNNGSNKAKKNFKARNWELIQIFLLQSRFFLHELSLYSLTFSSFALFAYSLTYNIISEALWAVKNANIKKYKRNYLFLKIGMHKNNLRSWGLFKSAV